jgi:uncharacterized protein YhaN
MEREDAALIQREKNLQTTQAHLLVAQGELQAWEPRHAIALELDSGARDVLRQARAAASYVTQKNIIEELTNQLSSLELKHEKALSEQSKLTHLLADAQALIVLPEQLQKLRETSEGLRTAQAKLDVVATALEFKLQEDAEVLIEGSPVRGSSRKIVIGRTDIEITGIGRITVLPGGADLDSLAAERDRKHNELTLSLQSLRADSLAAVEERARLHLQRGTEIKSSEAVLAILAPKGLATLAGEIMTLKAQLQASEKILESTPLMDSPSISVAQAEQEEADSRATLESISQGFNEAKVSVGNAQAQVQAAEEEFTALKSTLDDPLRSSRKAEANESLIDALAQQSTAQTRVNELAQQLETANLSLLAQDVDRLERSVKQAESSHTQRANEITRLEVELETKGALGLEETAAEKRRELDQAARRNNELLRRANALDHLLKILREKRSILAQKLRAPLQKHLNHYLQILFPGAQIEVGDDLSPSRITRTSTQGSETGEFNELSIGAREQMGVISRLAYADLLKEAGRPTLLILDDALVHTDEERLSQMKRVLYDAASRHQIFIFSCHPDAWQDIGVTARSLI